MRRKRVNRHAIEILQLRAGILGAGEMAKRHFSAAIASALAPTRRVAARYSVRAERVGT